MRLSRLPLVHHILCKLQGRSGSWPRVRRDYLVRHPTCAVCGGKKAIEVHHVVPFHKDKAQELNPGNLIALCNHLRCHILIGHLGNYKSWNEHVREMAASIFLKITMRP